MSDRRDHYRRESRSPPRNDRSSYRSSRRDDSHRRSRDDRDRDDHYRRRHRSRSPPRGGGGGSSGGGGSGSKVERSSDWDERRRRDDRGGRANDGPRVRSERKARRSRSNSVDRAYGKPEETEDGEPVEKEKTDFKTSGLLTAETNTVNGVVLKYTEPDEARMPQRHWRLYPFKEGTDNLAPLHLHRQSAYLAGREARVADIVLAHPSCSGQHAVLQFRSIECERDDGVMVRRVKPYIIDLESSNGTILNGEKIKARCYVELKSGDALRFGFSSREYVILPDDASEASVLE